MNKLKEMSSPVGVRQGHDNANSPSVLQQNETRTLDEVVNTARIRDLQRAAALLNEEGHTQLAESLREWTKRLNRALGMEEVPPEVWIG